MMIAPRKIEKFKEMGIEELIKEKHKIMKKIISLEKEYYLSDSNIVQDPSPEIILEEGDIINVDVSTIYNGYFSDASRMFKIGEVHPELDKLVRVAKECLDKGLEAAKPWGFLGDIAEAVQKHAESNGYSVVREFGGHGVGLEFHETPFVSHVGKKGTGMLLVPGMIFTIEPMINMGSPDICIDDSDGWTVLTEDGYPSAQWEYTVLVTETGVEILTQ